ncbi:MAG: hypothetical protein DMG96_18620 [Acidobacteria bacterium]|nr:MAG: hypothetical protein DMG96_18620 [Acidobacteriota bacterium]
MITRTNRPLSSLRPRTTAYRTPLGICLRGKAEEILQSPKIASDLKHTVDLIFTSPPFPLNRKNKYGNLKGKAYIDWLAEFADTFKLLLKPLSNF